MALDALYFFLITWFSPFKHFFNITNSRSQAENNFTENKQWLEVVIMQLCCLSLGSFFLPTEEWSLAGIGPWIMKEAFK